MLPKFCILGAMLVFLTGTNVKSALCVTLVILTPNAKREML